MTKSATRFFKSSKLFEFLMIFAGITLSMQFDNWNENRKLKVKELELLSAVYVDLDRDMADVKNVIKSFDLHYIDEISRLDSCLQSNEPVAYNELKSPLILPIGGAYMDQNSSAFESLKYEGANLIKNSRLKIKIFDYYDARLKWIKQSQDWQSQFGATYLYPIFIKYCQEDLRIDYANYLKLRKDIHALRLIKMWKKSYQSSQKLYKELMPSLLELKQDMEEELVVNGKDPKTILEESKPIV